MHRYRSHTCGALRKTDAGSTVRLSGWVEANYDVTIEIEGLRKPALTARWLTLTFIQPKEG